MDFYLGGLDFRPFAKSTEFKLHYSKLHIFLKNWQRVMGLTEDYSPNVHSQLIFVVSKVYILFLGMKSKTIQSNAIFY